MYREAADSDYVSPAKKSTMTALKRLYHHSMHDEIVVKKKGMQYDPNVDWITTRTRRQYSSSKSRN